MPKTEDQMRINARVAAAWLVAGGVLVILTRTVKGDQSGNDKCNDTSIYNGGEMREVHYWESTGACYDGKENDLPSGYTQDHCATHMLESGHAHTAC
jgi:hypothetical protein